MDSPKPKHMKPNISTLNEATRAFQREHIRRARTACGSDMLATAQALDISLAALYAKCKRLGIALASDKAKRKAGK